MKQKILSLKGNNINILILSAGTRNKIVQYFKRTLKGNGTVVATDMSCIAPAVYEADKFYEIPKITDPAYVEKVLEICIKEKINGVLSLIDPELSLLAENKKLFDEAGVTIIGSSYDLCERALNKMEMFKWLSQHNYNCAKSYDNIADFEKDLAESKAKFPVFVKPICGSASISIQKVNDLETVKLLFTKDDNLMMQEFLNGQEIGADVYIDMLSKEVVSIFTKKKLVMRAGETEKAVSFKDEKLFDLITSFVKESGYTGQIDIDIFDIDGEYYISEVNPRFGGGYPHAYECGCDHMSLIINNLNGIENKPSIGSYREDVYMMKYNEVMIKKKVVK